MSKLPDHWPADSDGTDALASQLEYDWCQSLSEFVSEERDRATIFLPAEEKFIAFRLTSLANTCVVILGEDP